MTRNFVARLLRLQLHSQILNVGIREGDDGERTFQLF